VPLGAALELPLELVDVVVVPVAALPVAELRTVPPSAPPNIDPAATTVRSDFFPMVIFDLLSSVAPSIAGRSQSQVKASCEFVGSA
jgi:hypothetical protein